jgi:GNAT superfamily N-acetyltransferase
MSKIDISIAQTADDIRKCFPVMRELRTHITDENEFVERVQRQQEQGYLLAYVESVGEVRAAAGYRYLESLFAGKFIYVDDLVTRAADRSHGFGAQLFDWLMNEARTHGCTELQLDSGVQRFDAHRFYLAKRMKISSHHFTIEVPP